MSLSVRVIFCDHDVSFIFYQVGNKVKRSQSETSLFLDGKIVGKVSGVNTAPSDRSPWLKEKYNRFFEFEKSNENLSQIDEVGHLPALTHIVSRIALVFCTSFRRMAQRDGTAAARSGATARNDDS